MTALATVALVLDLGSDTCRAGCAGEEAPRLVVPSTQVFDISAGASSGKIRVEALETLLGRAAFGVLAGCTPQTQRPVLCSEPNMRDRGWREALAEVLFEGLALPSAALVPSAPLCAFACGRMSAVVVDIGASHSSVAPVCGGSLAVACMREHPFAGRALDHSLLRALRRQGVELGVGLPADAGFLSNRHLSDLRLAQDLKETVCFCCHLPLAEVEPAAPFMHTLPDGKQVNVAAFSRLVPEALLIGDKEEAFPGVPALIADSFATLLRQKQGADAAYVRDALGTLLLVGGTSCFINFKARLQAAMVAGCAPQLSKKLKIQASSERHAAWLGGSVVVAAGALGPRWVSKQDYEERGTAVFEVQ